MICDENERKLISSLGWVEKGSLWIFDIESGEIEIFKLSEANYLSLHRGKDNVFSVVHHFDDSHVEITAHSASNPKSVISKIFLGDSNYAYSGDIQVWKNVPRSYVPYISRNSVKDFWLVLLDAENRNIDFQRFEWYDDGYDKGYQGIIGVTEIPSSELLLISVQRDSNLVLYDPVEQKLLRKIELGGRCGNPKLRFRLNANELWADDYDTILKLDPMDWSVKASKKLQDEANGVSQFIGDFSFNADESLCVVSRPFSGEVVALDLENLRIRYHCKTGNQPLEALVLKNKKMVARDWQTGNILTGRMKRRFFQ